MRIISWLKETFNHVKEIKIFTELGELIFIKIISLVVLFNNLNILTRIISQSCFSIIFELMFVLSVRFS
jgi:hypothetical protein